MGGRRHLDPAHGTMGRVGDHATNIAETLWFTVHGTRLTQARPKGDRSYLEVGAAQE